MTQLPKVVVSVSATADGRVALNRTHVLMEKAAGQMWGSLSPPSAREVADLQLAEIERRYQPGAVLEGSGSFVTDDVGPLTDLPPVDVDPEQLYKDHLPPEIADRPSPPHKWFTVVDGRGRVRWTHNGGGDFDRLILVAHATPAEYLAHLRGEHICYLVAGRERVDLNAAMSRMATRLGVSSVVSKAGGGLNAALVRAALVDELHTSLSSRPWSGASAPLPSSTGRHWRWVTGPSLRPRASMAGTGGVRGLGQDLAPASSQAR